MCDDAGQEGYAIFSRIITSLVLLQGATATCLHRGCHEDAQAGINVYNAIAAFIGRDPANTALGKPALDALWRELDPMLVTIVLSVYSQAVDDILLQLIRDGEMKDTERLRPLLESAGRRMDSIAPTQAAATSLVYTCGYHVNKTEQHAESSLESLVAG